MISLCTFVKNEAHCLGHMIKSVKDYVDEIIVVDTGSIDGTLDVAREFGARIYQVGFTDFGKIRTLTAHLAKEPWVLMLDADETLEYPEKLVELVSKEEVEAYSFPRKRWLDLSKTNQTEKEAYPDPQVRLFQNKTKYIWRRELHEEFHGGAVVDLLEDCPIINHFQDVFKDDRMKRERDKLYSMLSLRAGVTVHGGKSVV